MAKTKISEWDSVAANNTDINNININEGCPPSTINNAIRETMAQVKDYIDGSSGDYLVNNGGITSNGQVSFNGDTRINGQFRLNGSSGFAGQVFTSSGGTNVPSWTTLGTMSTQNANSVNISGTVQTNNFNATGAFKMNGSLGSAGQVLVSSGSSSAPTWGNAFVTGMIMLWSGSTSSVPSGWALCNGSSGTPDLRDRFVVGAGSTYAVDSTGGNAFATLPSHKHVINFNTVPSGAHSHYVVSSNTSSSASFTSQSAMTWASAGGLGNSDYRGGATTGTANRGKSNLAPTHTHTVYGDSNHTGSSSYNTANLPPYYALAYIMKL